MALHKIIEQGSEKFLAFALGRWRALKMLDLPYVVQRFYVEGVDISIRMVNGQDFIKLSGGAAQYLFYTTEELTGDGAILAGYAGTMVAGELTRSRGYGNGSAVYSTNKFISDPLTGFTVATPATTDQPQVIGTAEGTGFNDQRMPEYQHVVFNDKLSPYTGAKVGWCMSAWGTSNSNNLGTFDTGWDRNMYGPRIDRGLDLIPAFFPNNGTPIQKKPTEFPFSDATATHVYGRACVRQIHDPLWGTRTFFVMTDSSSNFFIYPTEVGVGDIVYLTRQGGLIVDTAHYTKIAAPFPVWVDSSISLFDDFPAWNFGTVLREFVSYLTVEFNAPTGAPPMYDHNRRLWSFNSDGTKAVATVTSVPYTDPSGLTHLQGHESYLKTKYDFVGFTTEADKVSFTGLVEVDIGITLTGAGIDDYAATVTLAQGLNGQSTGVYYCGADYAFGDKRLVALGLAEDDLVVATIKLTSTDTWKTNYVDASATGDFFPASGFATVPGHYTHDSYGDTTGDRRYGQMENFRTYVNVGKLGAAPALSLLCTDSRRNASLQDVQILDAGVVRGWAKWAVSSFYPNANPLAPSFVQMPTICLRSLSAIIGADNAFIKYEFTAFAAFRTISHAKYTITYGRVTSGDSDVIDPTLFVNQPETGLVIPVDETSINLYKNAARMVAMNRDYGPQLNNYGMVSAHPNGCVSFYWRPGYEYTSNYESGFTGTLVDRVEIKTPSGAKVLTHKTMFNKAFPTAVRDYDWYTPGQPGDQGVFASTGVWVTTPSVYTYSPA